jgi:hypothetical protein
LLAGDGFRGGVSPVLADPGRPGSVLDEIWSGRKLAACVTHLGGWRLRRHAWRRRRVGAATLAGAHAFRLLGLRAFANRYWVRARC